MLIFFVSIPTILHDKINFMCVRYTMKDYAEAEIQYFNL